MWLFVAALVVGGLASAGCGRGGFDDAQRASLKAEIKAEVLAELRARPGSAATVTTPTPTRSVLSDGERRAIAEARARTVGLPSEGAVRTPIKDTPHAAAPATLTQDDLQAAADDPGRPQTTATTAPSPQRAGPGTEIRPGARTWAPKMGTTKLIDLAVADAIDKKKRLPVQPATSYGTPPERLFCYTVFDNPEAKATVTHVWRRGKRLVSKVELEVGKSSRWRTWSRQRTRPHWIGPWSCEVLDADGHRLGLAEFVIRGGS